MKTIMPFLARILIVLIFCVSFYNKINDFEGAANKLGSAGIENAKIFLSIGLLFIGLGSLLVILGWKARLGAFLLLLFLVPTTILFHTDFAEAGQTTQLLKNLGIMGGLLSIIANGAGKISIDKT